MQLNSQQHDAPPAPDIRCRIATWPNAAPFALFLSHDVDQIHDRELFRWLGDINHLRRHWLQGETGQSGACIRRILRPFFAPADPIRQFKSMRAIESRHGWISSFFLLEDKYWSRKGGRFNWSDPAFTRISQFLLEQNCELGIHGSAYSHNNPQWWVDICQRFEDLFGIRPVGARNHHLKLDAPSTWICQREAGLLYDSTLGMPARLGAPDGHCLPFEPVGESHGIRGAFLELPLGIMDQTLFRYLNLDGEQALLAARTFIEQIIMKEGLVTLLWHNNFFAEEEFVTWENTYARLLDWMAPLKPWCACGRDIAKWWIAKAAVTIQKESSDQNASAWQFKAAHTIEHLAVELSGLSPDAIVTCDTHETTKSIAGNGGFVLSFEKIKAGDTVRISHISRTK